LGLVGVVVSAFIPGMHTNTLLVMIAPLLSVIPQEVSLCAIVALAIGQTVVDAIPALLFGVPDASLAVLPQHKFLFRGQGYVAIQYLTLGALLAGAMSILLLPLTIFVLYVLDAIPFVIIPIVIVVYAYAICSDAHPFRSLLVVLAAMVLGWRVFSSGVAQPLLVLLGGLFGLSSNVLSGFSKAKIPLQIIPRRIFLLREHIWASAISCISAMFFSAFPAVGNAHAMVVLDPLMEKFDKSTSLVVAGGLNTANVIGSLAAFVVLGKVRSGFAAALGSVGVGGWTDVVSWQLFFVLVCSILASGVMSFVFGRFAMKRISRIPSRVLSAAVCVILVCLAGFFSSWQGIFWLVVSGCLGVIAQLSDCRKMNLMAVMLSLILF